MYSHFFKGTNKVVSYIHTFAILGKIFVIENVETQNYNLYFNLFSELFLIKKRIFVQIFLAKVLLNIF